MWRDSDFVHWAHAAGERPMLRCGSFTDSKAFPPVTGLATHKVPIGVIEMLFDRSTIGPSDEARWESVVHADYNLGSRLHGTPAIADFVLLGAFASPNHKSYYACQHTCPRIPSNSDGSFRWA